MIAQSLQEHLWLVGLVTVLSASAITVCATAGPAIVGWIRGKGHPDLADVAAVAFRIAVKKGHGEELMQAIREELDSPEAHELARDLHLEAKKANDP